MKFLKICAKISTFIFVSSAILCLLLFLMSISLESAENALEKGLLQTAKNAIVILLHSLRG